MGKDTDDIVVAKASKKTEKLDILLPDPYPRHQTQTQEQFPTFKKPGQ